MSRVFARLLESVLLVALLSACATGRDVGPQSDALDPSLQGKTLGSEPRELATSTGKSGTVAPDKVVRVAAVGDIMLGASATDTLTAQGYDYPFEKVKHLFIASDVVIGNLEGPLTHYDTPYEEKQYIFKSPPEQIAPALARAGFNLMSLANNHTLDYGVPGLRATMAALDENGISYMGAGMDQDAARRAVIMELDGTRIGFLAYSLTYPESFWAARDKAGTAFGHEDQVREDVRSLKGRADIVVVSFHWGREGTTLLRPYQPKLAYAAIDEGAALVLGHHPHILQALERYRDGAIVYSLGNFAFGSFSPRAKVSAIASVSFRNNRFEKLEMVPINTHNFDVYFQPRLLNGADAQAVVAHLQALSMGRGTWIWNQGGVALLQGRSAH